MAKLRLKYDFADGPYLFTFAGSQIPPMGVTPTAKVFNVGTATYPVKSASSGNLIDIRGYYTHTSGDARNIYNRLYIYGSAGGEAARIFTSVMANTDTARGAHISLNFKAEAGGSECSGFGTPLQTTLHIPDIASWAPTGTLSALTAEIYSDGTASDPAGLTELSVLRLVNSGGSGKGDVDTDANVISIQGFTAAADTSKAISSVSLAELPGSSVGIRTKIGATTYYIPAVVATEWN